MDAPECYCLYQIRFAETAVRFFLKQGLLTVRKKVNYNWASLHKPNLEDVLHEDAERIQRLIQGFKNLWPSYFWVLTLYYY